MTKFDYFFLYSMYVCMYLSIYKQVFQRNFLKWIYLPMLNVTSIIKYATECNRNLMFSHVFASF